MCEFCAKHGEGKKWYLNANNYAVELLEDLKRRDFITHFYERYIQKGGQSISRMEQIFQTRPKAIVKMAPAYEKEMRENHFGQVVPVEDIYTIINMSNSIVRFQCGCMWEAGRKEGRYCFGLSFGSPAWYDMVDRTYFGSPEIAEMEHLTKEEATACIKTLNEKGMVHSIWTFGTPFIGAICNCDIKYCLGMRSTFGLGLKTMFRAEQYTSIDAEKCTGCGACRSKCQMNAIKDSGSKGGFQVDKKECIGCGVCRSACAFNAISYQSNPPVSSPIR